MADKTALQKRVLNASRGPAVWALRAQTDKRLYSREMLHLLQETPNLALREAMVTGLEVEARESNNQGFNAPHSIGKIKHSLYLALGLFRSGWKSGANMFAGQHLCTGK